MKQLDFRMLILVGVIKKKRLKGINRLIFLKIKKVKKKITNIMKLG